MLLGVFMVPLRELSSMLFSLLIGLYSILVSLFQLIKI